MTPRRRPGHATINDAAIREFIDLAVATTGWDGAAHRYAHAVWCSDLTPMHRLVALCYVHHGHRDANGLARLTYAELRQHTGIASNGTVTRAIRTLTTLGWLQPDGEHRPRGRRARYQLTIPPRTGDPAQ